LREEYNLRVFENMVLRGTFGAKREEITRKLERVHTEELSDLYPSQDNIRAIR